VGAAFLAAVIPVLAVGGCTGGGAKGPSAVPSGTPRQLLDDVVAAATAKGAVHLRVDYEGRATGTTTYDVGPGVGLQAIDLNNHTHLEARSVGGVIYLKGNFQGISLFTSLNPDPAAKISNQWLTIDKAAKGYDQLSRALTLDGVLDEMKLTGTIAQPGLRDVDGQRTYELRGTDPRSNAPQTLFVSTATGLPVGFEETVAGNTTTGHFSSWGAAPAASAPPSAVPFAQALSSPVPSPTPSPKPSG